MTEAARCPIGGVPRPHDLLWVADASALRLEGARPSWASDGWLVQAPVVVRRASLADPQQWPVGLRGRARHQRCAAWVTAAAVLRVQTPEDIAAQWLQGDAELAPARPCFAMLQRLAPALNGLPLAWGVTGGVGFTLASGIDVLRAESDLDLRVRAPSPSSAEALLALGDLLNDMNDGQGVRVDVQVEAAAGAFALQEWLRTGGPVLLKTSLGPRLCDDPWQAEAKEVKTSQVDNAAKA